MYTAARETMDGVPLRSAREALSLRRLQTIDVDEGENFELSPENERAFECFSRVSLTRYRDLQYLGLVPRNLEEAAVRKAIAMDDRAARTGTHREERVREQGCSCEHSDAPAVGFAASAASETVAFESVRCFRNEALADLLSEHYGTTIAAHSSAPELVRKWSEGIGQLRYRPIYVAALEDIRIKAKGKLTVNHKAKALLARNIYIHETGQVICPGAFLRMEASSIQSFTIDWNELKVYTDVKWHLAAN